jgi:tetratricopeptide (TPR) repeat protein
LLGGRTLSLALALLLGACASPEERFAEHVERAEQLATEGLSQAAILEYKNALKLQPENAQVYERIGDIYRTQSRFADALTWYHEAFRLDETRITAAMNEARLLVFHDAKRAGELVARGLQDAPELPVVHVTASQLALAQGSTARALAAAERAVELGPEDPTVWVQLGTVHQARIRESQQRKRRPEPEIFEAAIAAFEHLDRLEGGHPRAQIERARTLGVWGRHDEAVAGYKAAIELAVRNGNPIDSAAAGEALDSYARGRRDNDLRRFALRQIVAAKSDEYGAWDKLARLVAGQHGQPADEVYRELLDARPDDPQAHTLFTTYLMREGRDEEAALHLERIIDESLDDLLLWDELLRTKISQGRYTEARDVVARMAEAHPNDPATSVSQARLAIAEGRYEEGVRTLSGVVESREEFEPLRLLALAHHRHGDEGAARRAMDRALALSPRPPLAALRLDARLNHASGDWAGVLRNLQIVAGRGQELTPEEQVLGATALYSTGRPHVGRRILEEILASSAAPSEAALELARLERRRDPQRALRALRRAHARDPGSLDVLETLTHMEVERGDRAAATARLDAIVAAGRATPRALLLRAGLLRDAAELERAEADALRAFEANPELRGATDLLFQIYQAQARLPEVRRSYEQAEAAGVLHPGARVLLARLAFVDGDSERARDLLDEVLLERPRIVDARRDLAIVLAERREDLDRALELARQAEASDDPRADTLDAIGFVDLRAGRNTEALLNFRRAIQIASQRSDGREGTYHYHMGLAHRALGRDSAAVLAFQQALRIGGFPEAEAARRESEAARRAMLEQRRLPERGG